ncbi:hypothetical protein WDU94_010580 [Cyamophila willieti]
MKGFNSALGLGLAVGIGLYRVAHCTLDKAIDIVPADRVINAMVALGWYQTTIPSHQHEVKVFNFVSYNDNRVKMIEVNQKLAATWQASEESSKSIIWPSHCIIIGNSPLLYTTMFYILHFVPAIVFSLGEKLTRQKPQVMKFYRKIKHLSQVIAYFSLNEWQFENNNLHSMIDAMSIEDRKRFDASLSNFSWDTMLNGGLHRTIALYMLNESITKEDFRNKMISRVWVHTVLLLIVKTGLIYLILYFVAQLMNIFFFLH